MPNSRNFFPFFSSSLPSSHSHLHDNSSNAGNSCNNQAQQQRRLTRQKKLRHVTDDELGLRFNDIYGSFSSPCSPDITAARKSRSPDGSEHWSSSAVPLPLPKVFINRKLKTSGSSPGPSQLASPDEGLASAVGSRRRGFSHVINFGSVNYNLRLNVPARSAPTTAFSSPSVSPQRSKTVDLFPSPASGLHELRGLIDLDVPDLGPNRISFASHHKLLMENHREWLENNMQVNAHPLPLPPGALPSLQSPMPLPSPVSNHIIEKPIATSIISQWQKGRLIGRGTYGSVYEATNRETGALCAMKEVDIIPDDPKSVECIKQLEQEIRVLRHLKHRNIVQYYGSEIVDDHFYIYLEYVHPGSINKYVREHCGAITESIVRNFTRHILSGLAYLHSSKTIHRDIKGANLLVDANGVVKLADFGMAKHLTGLSCDLSLKGSPYWMAPEVIHISVNYTHFYAFHGCFCSFLLLLLFLLQLIKAVMQKDSNPNLALAVDIWSLGCTIIEMLNGKPPWSKLEGPQAMFEVLNKTPPIPEALCPEGKDFLHCCFRRNPAERPTAAMLLEHPFVQNSAYQNGSVPMQAFSRMNLTDKSHSPRNCSTHKIEMMSTSPDTRITNGKLHFNRYTKCIFTLMQNEFDLASHKFHSRLFII
ncbi:hypothetical protein CRYUN_Cryun08bG0090900 [Craigia yunnanensis]